MGGAVGRAKRVFRMYNIDNRVDRVLSREKPKPAPHHPTDLQYMKIDSAESNIASRKVHEKDLQLLKYLKDVKVHSAGNNPIIQRIDDTSSHPSIPPLLNRLEEPLDENSVDGAFGYVEPQRVPPGRVSLRQFLTYLQKYRDSPTEYPIDRFAEMYTIKPDVAQKLFKYHSLLAMQEFTRKQSQSIARSPHVAGIEMLNIDAEAEKKAGPETGIRSKF